MSEWNSKNKPGVKTRDPEYPDLTTDFADPYNDNNQYRGKDSLVGWYRFLGDGAVGRVDGGTTNTFPNMALTGSSGQTLTTSGSLGSAVYYEESIYGAAVTYKARYQSPFNELNFEKPVGAASVVSEQWGYSFNQQVTPYLTTNMANGALPFSGSKAEKNYFRITDTDNWNIYSSGAEFSVAVWVRMNDYQNGQQATEQLLPIITKVKQGDSWTAGGEFVMFWYPVSTTDNTVFAMVMDDSGNEGYARSGYFANDGKAAHVMDSTTYPEPLAVPPNGSWVHLVMTWNGTNTDSATTKPSSNSTDGIKTYINGHFMLYDNTMGSFDGDIRPATDSTCGDILINCGRDDDDPTAASKYTNQDIAEAAFWSKCLSPKEVKALYHGATQGIKKWDSGLVKNPARPQLQRLDDTDGNAYPTTRGSTDPRRLGKRTPHFDDTLSRMFLSSSALAAGDITMGARLPTDDRLLSASFSTPNKLPSLEVTATERSNTPGHTDSTGANVPTWGIDPRIMGNLPFLTASVTEFKDRYAPFDESRVYIDSNLPFYQSGSNIAGLSTGLGNKVQIVIPLHATGSARFGVKSDRRGEQWLMGYWNAKDKCWDKVGRGYLGPSYSRYDQIAGGTGEGTGASTGSTFHCPTHDPAAPGYNNASSGPVPYQMEGSLQRNVNFASIGFSPTATTQPIASEFPYGKTAGGDYDDVINQSQWITVNRPTDNFGFPYDARYQASDDQCIKMSDYIDAPFLLEKIVIHVSASMEIAGTVDTNHGTDLYGQERVGLLRQTYNVIGGAVYNTRSRFWAYDANFFLLNQRKGKFTRSQIEHHGNKYSGGGLVTNLGTKLTSSIPGLRCTNQDGTNNQTDFETVHDSRDLITYSQVSIAGHGKAGLGLGDPYPGGNIGVALAQQLGAGRNYSMLITDRNSTDEPQSGPTWKYVNQQITGSFMMTGSVRTTPIDRTGKPIFVLDGQSNSWKRVFLRNRLGGRMNPQSTLTDRRGFIKGLATGVSSSEGWVDVATPAYYPRDFAQNITGSARSTWTDTESPYLLLPGDKLVFGVQSSLPNMTKEAWPNQIKNNGNCEQNNWDNSSPGFNIEMLKNSASKIVFYGSYLKNHKAAPANLNQQLTTPSAHANVSGGPVLDEWEINIKEAYSGSYLDASITGSMTSPPTGWPRGPAITRSSLWASSSATPGPYYQGLKPISSMGIVYSGSGDNYPDLGGPFDGAIKPWVSSSAYHSSSVYGPYFSTNLIAGTGQNWRGDPETGLPTQRFAVEPASNRMVAATAFGGGTGDIFGFQRNVRLQCPEETYYDSLVPDPSVCWIADNQTLGWAGGVISETLESDEFITLGIGASMGGNQAGIAVSGGTAKYSNEWWLPSFPFEARYRGFSEPPGDDFKRKVEQNAAYRLRLCLPSFSTQNSKTQAWSSDAEAGALPDWMGFDPLGTTRNQTIQSAKCVGVVGQYVDGKKPGLVRSDTAYWAGAIFSTTDVDMEGTILPVLFGFGTGLSGSVAPYKRVAATGTSTYDDGAYKYLSNKPSGCKYGLYSWKPRVTSTIFRSNKFGQVRDMLEQRRYSRFYLSSDAAVEVDAPVVCQFKEPVWLAPTEDTDKAPTSTQCSNLSLFATSSVPYFDGEVKNRGPLIADGSDTIVIE